MTSGETTLVSETHLGKYQVEARAGQSTLLIDEPVAFGGLGSGPNPYNLLSAALGFGLQRFVQDIGAGLFITGERQYGFGDVIHIAVAGVNQQVTGTVEDVTLRVTRMRTITD